MNIWSLQVVLYHQILCGHVLTLGSLLEKHSILTNSFSFSICVRIHFCLFSGCEMLCHGISDDLTVLGILCLLAICILSLEKNVERLYVLCVWGCLSVYAVCRCTCLCRQCAEAWYFSPALHVMFEMGLTLSLKLSLAIQGRLTGQGPKPSFCLCPIARVAGMHHRAQYWGFEFISSCLHGKHFTCWVNPPALLFIFRSDCLLYSWVSRPLSELPKIYLI